MNLIMKKSVRVPFLNVLYSTKLESVHPKSSNPLLCYCCISNTTGPAVTEEGDMTYKQINNYSKTQGAVGPIYNSTYVVNYIIVGSDWISFDGVDVVRIKVSYAKEKALLGYVVWEISQDDKWVLSQAGMRMFLNHKMNF